MSLFKRIFKDKSDATSTSPASLGFTDSDADDDSQDEQEGRYAIRRDLVHQVLREVVQLNGIPSDWLDLRILAVAARNQRMHLHLTFLVRQGEMLLLPYVHAFQDSFKRELERHDPRWADWLVSLSWQFEGAGVPADAPMPDRSTWTSTEPMPLQPLPTDADDSSVEEDLKALYVIRDAAARQAHTGDSTDYSGFEPTVPGERPPKPR